MALILEALIGDTRRVTSEPMSRWISRRRRKNRAPWRAEVNVSRADDCVRSWSSLEYIFGFFGVYNIRRKSHAFDLIASLSGRLKWKFMYREKRSSFLFKFLDLQRVYYVLYSDICYPRIFVCKFRRIVSDERCANWQ